MIRKRPLGRISIVFLSCLTVFFPFWGIIQSRADAPSTGLTFSPHPTPEEFFRARIFAEPLVPVGGKPTDAENADLAAALNGYGKRSGPDDFAPLTHFLDKHPQSPWKAALLTDLGFEYYNTAHYSLAIQAWSNAWALAQTASDAKALAVVNRAFGELLTMYARLGHMDDLNSLLKSIDNHRLPGAAGEKVINAQEALWNMQNRPEISFRCGPLALRSIRIALNKDGSSDAEILKSASTQKGCSLSQVADLSKKIGLNYQMAFRNGGDYIVPSVVHWKVGHYAAMVSKSGDLYELQDPTFGNKTWATKQALDAETSGYFLVSPGNLPTGWRAVDDKEGATIWGKGMTGGNDPQHIGKHDLRTGAGCSIQGMARASIHLMDVNLNLSDQPLGYAPPVGPPVRFTVRYNLRDVFQPGNFSYGNLGLQWTTDWCSYVTDTPSNQLADVNLYLDGGGQRTYTGYDTNTQSFAYQQYDHNLLTRTGPASYQLLYGDGSKFIYSQSDGSSGSTRNIFLTKQIDPQGNALTFQYDSNLCLVAVVDAIGQTTTLTYGLPNTNIGTGQDAIFVSADPYKLTKVTDPFGRATTFNYQPLVTSINYTYFNGQISSTSYTYAWGLASVTDVIGITSQFGYGQIDTPVNQFLTFVSSYVISLTTPYGTTTFAGGDNVNSRSMEIRYPDGSRERVEYTQTNTLQAMSDPSSTVPTGMATANSFLMYRDSYYWDRTACALAYKDYSKARLYHFMHNETLALTSAALESFKAPLENRIWYDYPNQGNALIIAPTTLPAHVGRVLDDGSTQLYTRAYNSFGRITNLVDPIGRKMSYVYDTNGIDLLEIRQRRGVNNELLFKAAYNSQHRPLTATDASGETRTFTYNTHGQILTVTDPKNETTTLAYDAAGYLLSIDGPLPGTVDKATMTYDGFGRVRTETSVSGDTITVDYDNFDRITRATFPDGTFSQSTYTLLNVTALQDRAGRINSFGYDNMGQMTQMTDPLGRTTSFDWCRCGALKSFTDPMGRTTSWTTDVQGRRTAKLFPDGSQIKYLYEGTTSRVRQVIDEKQQVTGYFYNLDNTLASVGYGNSAVATPPVSFTYDPNYLRPLSMTDGIGTTTYGYVPIAVPPALGAGNLASVDGPLANDTITYAYDELGRTTQTSINGVPMLDVFDAAGRIITKSNALGSFGFTYDGASVRPLSKTSPNGQATSITYGDGAHDRRLKQITHTSGATPLSQFIYTRDTAAKRITIWSQQAGTQPVSIFGFSYDAVNQLLVAAVTNSGVLVNSYAYNYDASGNRLAEQQGSTNYSATYNALNQISTTTAPVASRTNEWDALHRLTAVNVGNQRTEFSYDGFNRLASVRKLVNGSETSRRRLVWCGERICEERDASGTNVTKRFFPQGVKVETGAQSGAYYYTRDHLGSIREVTDAGGTVRARYTYDPYGRRTKVSGDVDADFGFAGMFWSPEANLAMTHYRAYDPELGRWLSRDPLGNAELRQGANLYSYVGNGPVNRVDPMGLMNAEQAAENGLVFATVTTTAYYAIPALDTVSATCIRNPMLCVEAGIIAATGAAPALQTASTVTQEMQAVDCEVPALTLSDEIAANPTAETISTAIEEGDIPPELEVDDIQASAAQLKDQYQEIQPTMQTEMDKNITQNRDVWEIIKNSPDAKGAMGSMPPALWTDDMIRIDRMFNNLSQAYARQHGVSFDQGWNAIARMTGFNPELW